MPDFFKELRANYKSEHQLSFENSAISHKDGETSLFRFMRDGPLPNDFFHGLARFDKEYMINRAKRDGLSKYIEELKVPTLTFTSLINKHKIKNISLLQVDTEGYDFDVLKMLFSSNILPAIINYEWSELSYDDRCKCKHMLLDKGYSFIDVGEDTLCLLNTRKFTLVTKSFNKIFKCSIWICLCEIRFVITREFFQIVKHEIQPWQGRFDPHLSALIQHFFSRPVSFNPLAMFNTQLRKMISIFNLRTYG